MGDWIHKREQEAANKVAALLEMPIAHEEYQTNEDFDPWTLFPSVYGTYSSDFDQCAIDVLGEINSGEKVRDDLGAEMFREMLCTSNLCNYGTSPRVCFPTPSFKKILPDLLDRWKVYSKNQW